jgi:hypothetical protein
MPILYADMSEASVISVMTEMYVMTEMSVKTDGGAAIAGLCKELG